MIASELLLENDIVKKVGELFHKKFPNKKPLVIQDTHTRIVAGNTVCDALAHCENYCFDGDEMHADDKHVAIIQELLEANDEYIAVAVGSGTLNDLCKRASFMAGERQYMCVATAPSVDGFTSTGAAIIDRGLKVTLPCPAPALVIADPIILSNAPADMIASGYSDLMAKVPAGADWLIADALGVEKIHKRVWDMVQVPLKAQLAEPAKLRARDSKVAAAVFDGLIHAGFAMQEYSDSRPASGAEHLMSHVWEMNACCMVHGKEASHGFKVALGALTSTAIMEELLKRTKDDMARTIASYSPETWQARQDKIRKFVKVPSVQDRQIEICRKKFLAGAQLAYRHAMILEKWEDIRYKIKMQLIPFAQLREMFKIAGCPVEPRDICLSLEDHRYGIRVSQMMRNRYTVVDLLYETGLLDAMIDIVTDAKNGYFSVWD